jgi:hypothetical protein
MLAAYRQYVFDGNEEAARLHVKVYLRRLSLYRL